MVMMRTMDEQLLVAHEFEVTKEYQPDAFIDHGGWQPDSERYSA